MTCIDKEFDTLFAVTLFSDALKKLVVQTLTLVPANVKAEVKALHQHGIYRKLTLKRKSLPS